MFVVIARIMPNFTQFKADRLIAILIEIVAEIKAFITAFLIRIGIEIEVFEERSTQDTKIVFTQFRSFDQFGPRHFTNRDRFNFTSRNSNGFSDSDIFTYDQEFLTTTNLFHSIRHGFFVIFLINLEFGSKTNQQLLFFRLVFTNSERIHQKVGIFFQVIVEVFDFIMTAFFKHKFTITFDKISHKFSIIHCQLP